MGCEANKKHQTPWTFLQNSGILYMISCGMTILLNERLC